MKIGDRVKVERDEKLYPIRGTWRYFRGKSGELEDINKNGQGAWEYGVTLAGWGLVWFKKHEIRPVRAYKKGN